MTDDIPEYGPAMQVLTEKQRRFVLAMVEIPGCSHAEAARAAGYSDTCGGAKSRGYNAAHNPKVQDAIREEAGKRLHSASLIAANVVVAMLTDASVPAKEKLKAAGMLLDRTGFAAVQKIDVTKTDNSGKAIMERIKKAAAVLGVDPAQLLGISPLKVINHGD